MNTRKQLMRTGLVAVAITSALGSLFFAGSLLRRSRHSEPLEFLQGWIYPGSQISDRHIFVSPAQGHTEAGEIIKMQQSRAADIRMVTIDPYASVWRFYAGKLHLRNYDLKQVTAFGDSGGQYYFFDNGYANTDLNPDRQHTRFVQCSDAQLFIIEIFHQSNSNETIISITTCDNYDS